MNILKMKKYGLQLRIQPQNRQPVQPANVRPPGFGDNEDDDESDVNKDIARQAVRKRALKEIEEQQKKALEEDPSVFDYDGVYDEMKEAAVRPLVQDRQERQSKYIQRLVEKAKEREREHEIIYERKLAKERSKDEHLFADKDKFVTSAYKKKLVEQEKWMEEERLRELREARDDVTKKSDISDFYFNLSKNIAFGAKKTTESSRQVKQEDKSNTEPPAREIRPKMNSPSNSEKTEMADQFADFTHSAARDDSSDGKEINSSPQRNTATEQPSAGSKEHDHHKKNEDASAATKGKEQDQRKKNEDALAAAKARFWHVKKQKITRYG